MTVQTNTASRGTDRALPHRRAVLGGAWAAAASAAQAAAKPVPYVYTYSPPLRASAEKKGVFYGACVNPAWLDVEPGPEYEPDFTEAFARECNILVAEGSTKWNSLHPAPAVWSFDAADRLLTFAQNNRMGMRGHTLIWHASFPAWAEQALADGQGWALMETYIETVMTRYRGKFLSWDVVNEAVNPKQNLFSHGLRDTPWLRALGEDYIARAYLLASAADPSAQLVYNDYDLETNPAKADAALSLLRKLKEKGVPVHALGLQAHFDTSACFAHFDRFCAEVQALGLDIIVTELDVFDPAISDDRTTDTAVAATTREFLDRLFSVTVPKQILTWGLSDRHSWLSSAKWNRWRNPEGRHIRGLPLDANLRRKRMWGVISQFIEQI